MYIITYVLVIFIGTSRRFPCTAIQTVSPTPPSPLDTVNQSTLCYIVSPTPHFFPLDTVNPIIL